MFDHISIAVSDLERALPLYDAALAPLGIVRLWQSARAAGYGPAGFTGEAPFALVVPHEGSARPPASFHIAFSAPSREAVAAFFAGATDNGATDDGPPGIRENYDPGYYAAFVVDPDGNRLEAVIHLPAPGPLAAD